MEKIEKIERILNYYRTYKSIVDVIRENPSLNQKELPVNINEKTLSVRINRLVDAGILHRTASNNRADGYTHTVNQALVDQIEEMVAAFRL